MPSTGGYLRQLVTGEPQIAKGNTGSEPIVTDSGDDAISKLAQELNIKLDDTTKDYLVQYMLQEQSEQNSFQRSLDAEAEKYQRTVKDLQKAGLNPFLALQSLSGSTPSSSGQSISGGLYTSKKNVDKQNSKDLSATMMRMLAIVAAAFIGALL